MKQQDESKILELINEKNTVSADYQKQVATLNNSLNQLQKQLDANVQSLKITQSQNAAGRQELGNLHAEIDKEQKEI